MNENPNMYESLVKDNESNYILKRTSHRFKFYMVKGCGTSKLSNRTWVALGRDDSLDSGAVIGPKKRIK